MPDFPSKPDLALQVVTNPAAFHDQPALLASCWADLVEARGGIAHPERITGAAHLVVPDRIDPLEPAHGPARMARVTARVHAHVARRARFAPPADGGVPALSAASRRDAPAGCRAYSCEETLT